MRRQWISGHSFGKGGGGGVWPGKVFFKERLV